MELRPDGEVRIGRESDIVTVRKAVRDVSKEIGFNGTDITRIVTAASELARNVFHYADRGMMQWNRISGDTHSGLELIFTDHGPGIEDVEQAMSMGYTTRKGLGLGLPGAKRLMDDLQITSRVGKGTTVKVVKWKRYK